MLNLCGAKSITTLGAAFLVLILSGCAHQNRQAPEVQAATPALAPATPGLEINSAPALNNVSFIEGDVAGNRLKLYKIRSTENDRPVFCQQYLKSIVKNEKTGDYDIEVASFCDPEKK
jgi:hypothetical protein